MILERNETRLERNEMRLERNDTSLARNETRSGNLHLSGTVCEQNTDILNRKKKKKLKEGYNISNKQLISTRRPPSGCHRLLINLKIFTASEDNLIARKMIT